MGDTRAKKSGIGAEIEKQTEKRYDSAEAAGIPEAIRLWINAIVVPDHPEIACSEQRDLHKHLADGVMLCKLINKLSASEGKKAVSFNKKVASPFVAMGNITSFNDACVAYGLKKECSFQSTDLWEGRKANFLNVVNCIHSLGMKANEKGFQPTYTGQQIEYLDNE